MNKREEIEKQIEVKNNEIVKLQDQIGELSEEIEDLELQLEEDEE